MLVAFLIMLREGLEAALIVGIIASYLTRTGRDGWLPFVWVGIMLGIAAALLTGAILQLASAEFPQKSQELFEAIVGLVAVGVLTSMVFWMRNVSRTVKSSLQASVDTALATSNGGGWALVAMVFLAVAREGLESVFFLLAIMEQNAGASVLAGALLGLAASALLGYGLYTGSVRLNVGTFFRWTGVFVLFVAAGILVTSLRALHEAGVWNYLQTVVFDLSDVLPADSMLGTILSGMFGYQAAPNAGELAAYIAFLIVCLTLFFRPPATRLKHPAPASRQAS